MIEVIEAKYLHDYCIWLKFNDGRTGEVNLESDLWGPMFEPLIDKTKFKNLKLSKTFGTIIWENEADLSPENLYDLIK